MFPVPNTDFGWENVCIMNVWESDEILSLILYSVYLGRAFLIPLNNQVQGLYCKLQIEIFLVHLWPKHEAHGP